MLWRQWSQERGWREKGTFRRQLNGGSDHEDAPGANMKEKPGQRPGDNVCGMLAAQQDQHGERRWNQEMVMVWEQWWPKREPGPKPLRALQVTQGRQSPAHQGSLRTETHLNWLYILRAFCKAHRRCSTMTAVNSALKSVTWGSESDPNYIVTEYLGEEEMLSANAELTLP